MTISPWVPEVIVLNLPLWTSSDSWPGTPDTSFWESVIGVISVDLFRGLSSSLTMGCACRFQALLLSWPLRTQAIALRAITKHGSQDNIVAAQCGHCPRGGPKCRVVCSYATLGLRRVSRKLRLRRPQWAGRGVVELLPRMHWRIIN